MLERAIYDRDQTRRVGIYRRDDGSYRYADEELISHDGETFWVSVEEPEHTGIYDSVETAVREAQGQVPWLAHQS
jgi:hypothetical protein